MRLPTPPALACCTALVIVTAVPGCHRGDEVADPPGSPPNRDALYGAFDALGGETAITAFGRFRMTGEGKTFEPGQTAKPADPPIAGPSYAFARVQDSDHDRVRVDSVRAAGEPFYLPFTYGAIIQGGSGDYDATSGWISHWTQQKAHAMRADRLAAMRKTRWLEQPERVLLDAVAHPERAHELPDETFEGRPHHVVGIDDPRGHLRVFVDAATRLPSKIDTLEDDPVLGDSLVEVRFSQWAAHAGVAVAGEVVVAVAGKVVRDETREEVVANAPIDEALFPPAAPAPSDPDLSGLGESRSAYYDRNLCFALDIDSYPGRRGATTLTEAPPGSKIWVVGGETHNSLAIETETGIVMVEAPIDDFRSAAVMAAVTKQIPNKPITHLVSTHHHHDHVGGARAYIARGATIVAAAQNEGFFRDVAKAPHTIRPDALAQRSHELKLALVGDDGLTIGDGRAVRVFPIATPHAEGMLMVYVPDAKLLFESDLYAPGLGKFGTPLRNPPVGRLFVAGASLLYDTLVASNLDVAWIAGGHGVGTSTMDVLKRDAGK